MVLQKMQEIVDVLANPYLYGMASEKNVPMSVRRQGEIFSGALLSLRTRGYPATYHDKSGTEYFSARAFAILGKNGKPVYGTVVFAGNGYDIYVYDEFKMRLEIAHRGVKIEGETSSTARKSFLSALRSVPYFAASDVFSVRVLVSKDEFSPRGHALLSDGDIEADSYG